MDYIDYDALISLDIDPDTARRLLAGSPLTGHDGRRVISAEELSDRLGMIERENGYE
jgi:hypothetical protein